jgi:hypothetical protein
VVTATNLESVLGLGHLIEGEGIDYWGLGVYLEPDGHGRMIASLDPWQTEAMVHRVADEFSGSPMPIVFEVEPSAFERISGMRLDAAVAGPWRLEHQIPGSSLCVATISPTPGRWLRMRYDGQLLGKSDLTTIGVLNGRYGKYEPGKITQMLDCVRENWSFPAMAEASLAQVASSPSAGRLALSREILR